MKNDKVSLRAVEPEDLDLLYQIENNQSLWDVGTTNVPYSRYALHDYVAHSNNDIYVDRQVRLMINNSEGQTVGIIDITNFNPQHQRAELGIVIESRYRGKGYAKAASELVMRYALAVLHLHQLYVIVDAENEVSVSLFESLGFKLMANLKEWLYDGRTYHDAWVMQTFL